MCISRRKWRLIMSTPYGIYSLNSHLKDSISGFTHSAPPEKSYEGGIRPKASEPPNKQIGVRIFSFLAGTKAVVPVLRTHGLRPVTYYNFVRISMRLFMRIWRICGDNFFLRSVRMKYA